MTRGDNMAKVGRTLIGMDPEHRERDWDDHFRCRSQVRVACLLVCCSSTLNAEHLSHAGRLLRQLATDEMR